MTTFSKWKASQPAAQTVSQGVEFSSGGGWDDILETDGNKYICEMGECTQF